jgi:hypothetical protein
LRHSALVKHSVLVFALASGGACGAALAEGAIDRWQFGSDDSGLVTASLRASSKLTAGGGALSYSPTLTIACHTDGEPRWSEWLNLSDVASSRKSATVSVAMDGGEKIDESWTSARRGKVLTRDGADAVHRLLAAKRLTLSWRFGLLAGRGEADFDLSGIGEAVGKIAEICNADLP